MADTLPKILLRNAESLKANAAIRQKNRGIWRTWSWLELSEQVAAIAAALSARGLVRGAHMAFIGDNSPRLHATMCAAHALGAIVVPLYQDASAAEMLPHLQSANVTHVFAEDQEQVDKVLAVLPNCPSIRGIVFDKDRGMRHYEQPQLAAYTALLEQGLGIVKGRPDFLASEIARGSGSDDATLIFTPGTSGPPKGVVLTHAALIGAARAAATTDALQDSDVALVYLPPAWIGQHIYGYAQPLVVGFCICAPESSETMFADLREIGPTYFLATPSVLEAMAKRVSSRMEGASGLKKGLYNGSMVLARNVGPKRLSRRGAGIGGSLVYGVGSLLIYGPLRDVLGMSRVRVAYSSCEAISPRVLTFFRGIGINVKQLYGAAETGFAIALHRDGDVAVATVGPAAEGVEIRLGPNQEIEVRSPGLFRGYHGDRQATEQAFTADGWYRTGDAGQIGPDGHLRIIDRIKDVGSLRDGTVFAPRAIENRLKASPYIKEAVAFGSGGDSVMVLIDIDGAAVGGWANKQAIAYSGHADLASRDEAYGLIHDVIAEVNADLAKDPSLAKVQVRRFAILPKELDADDGVLTRMRTLRRHVVAERFKGLVEAADRGSASARLDAEFGSDTAIRIAEVTSSPPARTRKAA